MNKKKKLMFRKNRVSSKLHGTSVAPRLCIFRSSKHVYAQLIDDEKGITILGVSEKSIDLKALIVGPNRRITLGNQLGIIIAKKAIENKIKKVVFDRRGYAYHGIVKAVAEGAREGGLQF